MLVEVFLIDVGKEVFNWKQNFVNFVGIRLPLMQ